MMRMNCPSLNRLRKCQILVVVVSLCSSCFAVAQDALDKDYAEELPRIPAVAADKTGPTFEIAEGYEIQLVAAEPLVQDPIAIAFDEIGRAYVVEMRGYSEHGEESLGVVRCLEDTDGDGRYDKNSMFAEGLAWPTAVCCFNGGVLIGVAPDIIYCKDTDGDGVADLREVWFTGFGRGNVQGLINSFCWGLDNRIYGVASASGGTIKSLAHPDAPAIDVRGRDFVIDPRDKSISSIAGGGQHGMSFDMWGNRYTCSNSDHIQQFMFEDRYLARNPFLAAPSPRLSIAADGASAAVYRVSAVEPWRLVRTRLRVQGIVKGPVEGGGRAAGYFTSATGVTIYQGDALPADLLGNAWIGDVGSNLVHRKLIQDSGIAKTAVRVEQNTEFLRSRDIWFRPVQFANAPDGSLYVLDMYREVIEHPLSLPELIKKHLDLDSGGDRGRIYRVVPKGFTTPQRKWPGAANQAELVDMLSHRNGWHRETAARLLCEKRAETEALLEDLVTAPRETASHPQARIRALYLLADLAGTRGAAGIKTSVLLAALVDDDPHVRRHAVRLAERQLNDDSIREKLVSLTGDENLDVRYQLAFSLGEVDDESAREALARLARQDAGDAWMRLAILSSLASGKGLVLQRLVADPEFCQSAAGSRFLIELVRQFARQRDAQDVASVARLLKSQQSEPQITGPLLLALMEGAGQNYAALKTSLDAAGQFSLDELTENLVSAATKTANDKEARVADRVTAISLLRLAGVDDFVAILQSNFVFQQPPEIQQALLQIAGRFADKRIAATIAPRLVTLSPTVRGQAMNVLFSRCPWLDLVLEKLESREVDPLVFSAAQRQALLTHADAKVRERANSLLGAGEKRPRESVVEDYRVVLKMQGDKNHGRELFRGKCATCHRLEEQGQAIGPNLAAFANRGGEAILLNLLDPNREVDARYIAYIVELVDGRTFSGLISGESATSVTLYDNQGKSHTILRADIEAIGSTAVSLMPENLESELNKQAVADLLEYLYSMRE